MSKKPVLTPPTVEDRKLFEKMVNQDYKFFTKTIDKDKLYNYLFMGLNKKHVDIPNLQSEFDISSTTARQLWDYIIDNKVLVIWDKTLEYHEDDPIESPLWVHTKSILEEDFYREIAKIQISEKKFLKTL